VLIGRKSVEYATTNLTRNQHGHLEGTLAVYTPASLFVQRVSPTADGGGVDITVVARASLRRLETSEEEHLPGGSEDGGGAVAATGGWPADGRVIATYEALSRGLMLPQGLVRERTSRRSRPSSPAWSPTCPRRAWPPGCTGSGTSPSGAAGWRGGGRVDRLRRVPETIRTRAPLPQEAQRPSTDPGDLALRDLELVLGAAAGDPALLAPVRVPEPVPLEIWAAAVRA
jgi:hypothetical protein